MAHKHSNQIRFETRDFKVSPVPKYTAASIKALRASLEVSQETLAVILNTSVSTVRQWEIGLKRPGGTSAKLLHLLENKGIKGLI
jgi:putative transcriptional regulator